MFPFFCITVVVDLIGRSHLHDRCVYEHMVSHPNSGHGQVSASPEPASYSIWLRPTSWSSAASAVPSWPCSHRVASSLEGLEEWRSAQSASGDLCHRVDEMVTLL